MNERRQDSRRRVCFAGQVETAAFMVDTPCMVRDVSLTGARIRIAPGAILPERVVLHVPLRSECRVARLVWREGDMVGLRFEPAGDEGRPVGGATDAAPRAPAFVLASRKPILH